ncbi:hypothetical protein BS78_02G122500 [Paspalum vaginatum]|nr:hypothetical protein BS78_02G122500 [Paspalum vaginatum]
MRPPEKAAATPLSGTWVSFPALFSSGGALISSLPDSLRSQVLQHSRYASRPVLIAKYNPATDQVTEFSASSCLTLVLSLNFCSVTTTEGLGNSRDGFHAVQERISGFHASQCGFCTPGMCMSIFSSLVRADSSARPPQPSDGFSKLTVAEAEKAFSGNLCRCTGYRPILDACKSFASDVDLEDLGLNIFWRRGDKKPDVSQLPSYTFGGGICTFPDFLKDEIKSLRQQHVDNANITVSKGSGLKFPPYHLNDANNDNAVSKEGWYHPRSIKHECSVKIVVGNTSAGVYKDQDLYNKYIDIGGIPELSSIVRKYEGIEIGAAITISRSIEILELEMASPFVRNTSLGGNIILAQNTHFPRTLQQYFSVLVQRCIQVVGEQRRITLEEFLEQPPLDHTSLLLSIFIPHWISDSQTEAGLVFQTYRAASRPLGNAVSYVNSAFLGHVSFDESSGGLVLSNLRLAFGAYGTEHAIRARKVEEFLTGKALTASIVQGAIQLLKETVVPMKGTSHPEYRISVAVGFIFSFLSAHVNGIAVPRKTFSNTSANSVGIIDAYDSPFASRQETIAGDEYKPIGEPIKKYGAVYVDDIPAPKNCVHGEFIYSTQPLAFVKNIKFKSSTATQKIITEQNIGSMSMFGDESLFGDPIAEYAGQALGVVIAETQRYADMAAKQAMIEYDTADLKPPYFNVPDVLYPKQVGDFSKGMAEADHKILSTENALISFPYYKDKLLYFLNEGGSFAFHGSQQRIPSAVWCLGIPFGNVRVITRRVGGGFGGKAYRSFPLRCPVQMYLNRNTDMIMVGSRHPMKAHYSVGFKSDGKITALHLDLLIDAGISEDLSPVVPSGVISALKKYNWGALSFDIKLCKTNNTSKSSMRAPGDTQGSLIAEAIIEHVASVLSLNSNCVREMNFHTYDSLLSTYTLPSIFNRLALTSNFLHRADSIKQFNSCNKWQKRGISCVPLIFSVTPRPAPGRVSILQDGSIVVEVGGIEIGQGLWTKVQQMTAFALGQLWPEGCEGLLERVRVLQADTLNLIQGGVTGGSSTSESSCAATLQACKLLINRLNPVMNKLRLHSGTVSWDNLISQVILSINCLSGKCELSASAYWVPEQESNSYLNYGAGISEVEIDLLTGAITILRSDLVYDCGMSLNPAVDLGQIEGSFIQGIGFFIYEEHQTNSDGLVVSNSTWDYKIPSVDTIPKQFNVEVLNTGYHKNRVLSSKASGEPAVVLASSVHCALREAIRAARKDFSNITGSGTSPLIFQLNVPAPMTVVKELCGFDIVEKYLENLSADEPASGA